ncbi:MAG: AraC family transcriptional regulator, partial [Bacteroidia bacterium]|nr:AraC family transcriptional regulator [Bacteroidia bacterium]
MDFNLGSYAALLLIFFFHGVVFSFLLLRKGIVHSDRSSLWLSLFVFLGAMYIAPFLFGYAGWYARDGYRDVLFFVPFQQLLLIGPILYYYTQSLLNESFRLNKSNLIHLLAPAIYLVYILVVFVVDVFVMDEYYFYADGRDMDLDLWYQIAGLISMIFYLVLSLLYYNNYRKNILDQLSYAETVTFRWIQ